jgi:hypothetical protein
LVTLRGNDAERGQAKNVPTMAPVRMLRPIGWDGCAAGGSQSGVQSSSKGRRGSTGGRRLVRVATWPSVVRTSAECINVVKAGVISRGVTHTVAWLE